MLTNRVKIINLKTNIRTVPRENDIVLFSVKKVIFLGQFGVGQPL